MPSRRGRSRYPEGRELADAERLLPEPAEKLVAEWGLSGRGLAKACHRLKIPVPPRGFWAKAQRRQPRRPRLPDLPPGEAVEIVGAEDHEPLPCNCRAKHPRRAESKGNPRAKHAGGWPSRLACNTGGRQFIADRSAVQYVDRSGGKSSVLRKFYDARDAGGYFSTNGPDIAGKGHPVSALVMSRHSFDDQR